MKTKITLEQIGKQAWTWKASDRLAKHLGGKGVVASSGCDGGYGCFASASSALADAERVIASLEAV